MVERYQLSSHARGDTVNAQYNAQYAGEAPGVVVSLVVLPILPPSTILGWMHLLLNVGW